MGVVQKSPIFTPGVAKAASSAAMARSQVATSWQPAAVAMPCTSAITGCGMDWIFCISSVQTSKMRRYSLMSRPVISAEVVAGAEDLAGGGQNDGANFAIAADFVEAAISSSISSSESALRRSRTVQGDDGDGAFVGDLEIHEVHLCASGRAIRSCGSCRWRCAAADRTPRASGHLKCARRSRHQAINSSAVAEQSGLEADVGLGHLAPFFVGRRRRWRLRRRRDGRPAPFPLRWKRCSRRRR